MSRYNQRINTQLLTVCGELSNEALQKETNAFFSNIIAYWNHILFGDLILLRRLAQNEVAQLTLTNFSSFPEPKSPQDIYCTHLLEISELRKRLDELINYYCDNLTDEACERFITYTTTEGENITKVVADVTQHMFNHQTHHRGQVTTLLSQSNIDIGITDLVFIQPNVN